MPQTILAVLTLMVTITLSLSTHRQLADQKRGMMRNEIEVMATGIALQAMETIRSRDFDRFVADHPNETADDPQEDFEPKSSWTSGDCEVFHESGADCNDIDDFHGMNAAKIKFEMGGTGKKMPFHVRVQVRYMTLDSDDNFVPAGHQTYHKEVRVKVQDAPSGGVPLLDAPIRLSRVFSYNHRAKNGHDGGTPSGGGGESGGGESGGGESGGGNEDEDEEDESTGEGQNQGGGDGEYGEYTKFLLNDLRDNPEVPYGDEEVPFREAARDVATFYGFDDISSAIASENWERVGELVDGNNSVQKKLDHVYKGKDKSKGKGKGK
jgi:uncharacterized membrane protein YgcG